MKNLDLILVIILFSIEVFGGKTERHYSFSTWSLQKKDQYSLVQFPNTIQAGKVGEPSLPYHAVSLLIPPGESAVSIEFVGEGLTEISGITELYPFQSVLPISNQTPALFEKNEAAYRSGAEYPSSKTGRLSTQYLHGYSFALSTFTPVVYYPLLNKLYFYQKVTVTVTTSPDPGYQEISKNFKISEQALKKVERLAQNPEMISLYPAKGESASNVQLLILSPGEYEAAFLPLREFYAGKGMVSMFTSVEFIDQNVPGSDLPEKIRQYIISAYQDDGIEQVILGGDVDEVPYRGFYCYVQSGTGVQDANIPADIYYAGLDGNWNTDGDSRWAEPGEEDFLPELSVGRMSFSNSEELENMIHKSISYQENSGNWPMNKPYLVSEYLYTPPPTYGSDYLELLIDDHADNGYFTHGIPSVTNNVTKLYDEAGFNWPVELVITGINQGKSFIHHCGHSNVDLMMRMSLSDVTNQTFNMINGVDRNYQLMYTHGCYCGAFDNEDCIAERAITIDNWLAAGVFNSRYGWFNNGQTEGPSAHLHREFVSAVYHPDADSAFLEIGSAHTMSKIMTAPWCNLPGEFEPGAQRFCMYDCNVLGDPALKIWIDNPFTNVPSLTNGKKPLLSPNPCFDKVLITLPSKPKESVEITVYDLQGIVVKAFNIVNKDYKNGILLSTEELPSGAYLCGIAYDGEVFTEKMVIIR